MERTELPSGKYSLNDLVGLPMATIERYVILETLERAQGNRTHAAKILGISIRGLRNKLKKYRNDDHLNSAALSDAA